MKFNTGETSEELRAQYNPEGSILYQAQQRLLDMLLYIDSVCREQGIAYCLDGGNVLGAVRHGGFIPWDDDVDIILQRADFDRLCAYLVEHPHPQYVLQSPETERYFVNYWNVLRDTHSEYIQQNRIHKLRTYRGLQIDLFPLDENVLPGYQKFLYKWHHMHESLFLGRCTWLCRAYFYLGRKCLVPFGQFLSRHFGKNQGCLSYGYGTFYKWAKWQYPKEVLYPTVPLAYEGKQIQGPASVEQFLQIHFGSYQNLPPKDCRNDHQATYKIW